MRCVWRDQGKKGTAWHAQIGEGGKRKNQDDGNGQTTSFVNGQSSEIYYFMSRESVRLRLSISLPHKHKVLFLLKYMNGGRIIWYFTCIFRAWRTYYSVHTTYYLENALNIGIECCFRTFPLFRARILTKETRWNEPRIAITLSSRWSSSFRSFKVFFSPLALTSKSWCQAEMTLWSTLFTFGFLIHHSLVSI